MALPAVSSVVAPARSLALGQADDGAVVGRDPVLNAPAPRAVRRERRRTDGLATPRAGTLRPPSQTVSRAVRAISGNATLPMRALSGRAWDLALVAALETQWRSMSRELVALSPVDREHLADAVTQALIAENRLRASDADGKRLVGYAVRLRLERAAETAPLATRPTGNARTGAPAGPAPQVDDVQSFDGAPDSAIAALQRLAAQPASPRRAAEAQRIVDGATRRLIAAGTRGNLDAFIARLQRLDLQVSNLPVEFRDGWSIAVNDGRVAGTTDAGLVVGMRAFDGYYRSDLRDVRTGSAYWLPRQVDLVYDFDADTRTVSAAAYARTLKAQHDWQHSAGWPRGGNPYDLAQVRAHVQQLLDRGIAPSDVFTRWQQYLTAFYLHCHSLDIQGALKVGGMQDFDIGRLTHDTQGLVNDLLPARTGQRLLDCEFFAAITTHVFGGIRRSDGQPRFQTYWVLLDTHAASVVVERPTSNAAQPRSWAFVNNNYVMARGTTTVRDRLDPAIVDAVGKNILSGRPAIFAVETTHRAAQRGAMDLLVGPRLGANMYDGDVSQVAEVDRRAYWIFAETRADRFSEHAKHEDFVRSWSR